MLCYAMLCYAIGDVAVAQEELHRSDARGPGEIAITTHRHPVAPPPLTRFHHPLTPPLLCGARSQALRGEAEALRAEAQRKRQHAQMLRWASTQLN